MKKIISLCILLIFAGCKTNPPETLIVPPIITGKVYIEANVSGALIYVDNVNTGKFSPDTILTGIGNRIVRLEKENYIPQSLNVNVKEDSVVAVSFILELQTALKLVLLEDFSNVSCVPCVISNRITEALTRISYGPTKLVAIKYPVNWPLASDPFYMASTANCEARRGYYNISIAPTVIIDGRMRPTPSDSTKIKDSVNVRLALSPKFKMSVSRSITDSVYNTIVKIETLDTTGINFSNLVLHTVVTEIEIEFASPPGSNGERKFYDVMREMLPNFSGEAIPTVNQSGEFTYNRSFVLSGNKASWDKTKLHTIAFIQDRVSKEIYQAASTH